MRHLTPRDYRRMPWRNGGGTTTEIAIYPDSATLGADASDRFLYRVSIADVAVDGPFSRFDGYERHIMLLAGAGMRIDAGEHGIIDLTRPFDPRPFSGDWSVSGALVNGPVRDFNLIVDRARAKSSLVVNDIDGRATFGCDPGDTCILHIIEGKLAGASAGDTLVTSEPIDVEAFGAARLAVARIHGISG